MQVKLRIATKLGWATAAVKRANDLIELWKVQATYVCSLNRRAD